MPILWPCVIATVLVTYKPAAFLTSRLTQKGDSFHAVITLNIMCTVFLMSIILTIVGTWVGNREITMEPLVNFFYKWPCNFAISLAVEILIAQPIARRVMLGLHKYRDARREVVASNCAGNNLKKQPRPQFVTLDSSDNCRSLMVFFYFKFVLKNSFSFSKGIFSRLS